MGYEIFMLIKETTVDQCAICIRTGQLALNSSGAGGDDIPTCFSRKRAHAFWMMFMRSW